MRRRPISRRLLLLLVVVPCRRDDVLGRPLRVNDEVLAPRRPRCPEERTVERVVVSYWHRLSLRADIRRTSASVTAHVLAARPDLTLCLHRR